MLESEKSGKINDIQKEKLQLIQKQIDSLLILISKISVAKLDEIKHDHQLNWEYNLLGILQVWEITKQNVNFESQENIQINN